MLQQLTELISNIASSKDVSTEIIETCEKCKLALEEAEKQIDKKNEDYKNLQDKYAKLVINYPVSSKEPDLTGAQNKEVSLLDCFNEIKQKEKQQKWQN